MICHVTQKSGVQYWSSRLTRPNINLILNWKVFNFSLAQTAVVPTIKYWSKILKYINHQNTKLILDCNGISPLWLNTVVELCHGISGDLYRNGEKCNWLRWNTTDFYSVATLRTWQQNFWLSTKNPLSHWYYCLSIIMTSSCNPCNQNLIFRLISPCPSRQWS